MSDSEFVERMEHIWEEEDKSRPRMDIRLALMNEDHPMTTREVAKAVDRDKSNVRSYLNKMVDDEIVESETRENGAKIWSLSDQDWEPPQYVDEEEDETRSMQAYLWYQRLFVIPFGMLFAISSVYLGVGLLFHWSTSGWGALWQAAAIGLLTILGVAVVEVYEP